MENIGRERSTQPAEVPTSLAPLVAGYGWARVTVGESGDAVYRLHDAGIEPDLYLKHASPASAQDVAGEMVRLQWLSDHVAVPEVRAFVALPGQAWLLTTALPGKTAYQLLEANPHDGLAIIDALARFLRRLHSIPVEGCPFNSDHRLRLGEARWRIDRGLVDLTDFDEERAGWTAEQVWGDMTALCPFEPDPVVTHGDFSLDNVLLADGGRVGCIDVGRAGIADRYQDLAIAWHCLKEFGPALQQRLLSSYGIERPDLGKIRFHLLLDELF